MKYKVKKLRQKNTVLTFLSFTNFKIVRHIARLHEYSFYIVTFNLGLSVITDFINATSAGSAASSTTFMETPSCIPPLIRDDTIRLG